MISKFRKAIRARVGLSITLALATAVASGGLYFLLVGGEPEEPYPNFTASRPSPTAPAQPSAGRQAPLADVPTMVRGLEQRLEQSPDNPEGWRMLGWSYLALQRYQDAAQAYGRAIGLDGGVARYRSGYGEALVRLADNTVEPEARASFETALAIDPDDLRAGFFLGLAKRQSGDLRGAYDTWLQVMAKASPNTPVQEDLRGEIASLSRELGIDTATAAPATGGIDRGTPESAAPSGPAGLSQEELNTITETLAEDRTTMILGMVEGLAERLREEPDDLQGWIKLERSYRVLGDSKKADAAQAQIERLRQGQR